MHATALNDFRMDTKELQDEHLKEEPKLTNNTIQKPTTQTNSVAI